MAAKSLGTLTLDLVAKIGGFEAGLDKASRKSKQTSADISKYAKNIGIGVAAGVTAAAAGIAVMVSNQREAIDVQAKMAQRLRTSFESLSNLGRAGELAGVSLQQIEVASRSLDINLGRANQGVKTQVDAFKKLKLSADDIAKLPLDERIKTINTALKENVSETERAAVAADLFGSRGAAAIQQLTPDTIAEAARQVEIFGLNLSDIDAAKVEMANDAMSTFGLLSDGIAKQLTVELAPILKALGDEFLESAEQAGGLGNVVEEATRDVVRGVAFMVNAADGVGRAFEIAADTAILAISALAAGAAENVADLLSLISVIPGVDYSQAEADVRAFAAIQKGVFAEAQKSIEESLKVPLAGQKLLDFYDEAQRKAEKLAATSVTGRIGPDVAAGPTTEELRAIESAQKAAEKAAQSLLKNFQSTEAGYEKQIALIGATTEAEKLRYEITAGNLVGINDEQQQRLLALADELDAVEKLNKAQDDYASLIKELRTDSEKLNDQLTERLNILNAVSGVSEKEKNQSASRIAEGAFEPVPEYSGLAPEIGGAGGELFKIDKAEAELEDWYSEQLEMLATYRAEKSELNAQWDEQELALRKEHEAALADIEYARQVATLASTEEMFGNLAGAAREFAGEHSAIYKTLFAVEKAAAIARSVVAIQTGIAQAAANPWPANLAAMASVAAATASIVGNISAVTIGQAHDGIDSVPKSGTWNLEKGERVTTAKTSAKLDKTLSEVQSGMRDGEGGGSSSTRIINMFDSNEVVGGYLGSKAGEKAIMNVVSRNRRTIQSF